MVGSMRWTGTVLTCLSFFALAEVAGGASPWSPDGPAQEPAASAKRKAARRRALPERGQAGRGRQAGAAPADGAKLDVGAFFNQPGDEPPRPLVPLHASTVDDRQRTEAMRLYSAARALEDRGSFGEAVALLQQAQKLDPESVAIIRRLSRIYLGTLGKPDQAVEFGKKVLAVEPGDTDTLSLLVEYYNREEGPRRVPRRC